MMLGMKNRQGCCRESLLLNCASHRAAQSAVRCVYIPKRGVTAGTLMNNDDHLVVLLLQKHTPLRPGGPCVVQCLHKNVQGVYGRRPAHVCGLPPAGPCEFTVLRAHSALIVPPTSTHVGSEALWRHSHVQLFSRYCEERRCIRLLIFETR
ncbi:hypothetical protein FA95DRAFT_1297608 [Auriscalpium vulgare]|uniref:Uncharacterized protein n=1 Tax=Auriscalpium vulgare TaxID=40419 RepID=A0ACB8R1Z8_9AGAM|nr:hypothetical protein FA95DRAFT_1297608 [Auriscalpium vulgare]